ncbi:MAG: putative capsid protein [Himalivirus chandais]|uniref:Capsid protein n=1 Tax=Cressdnaviricota sp. TaxID=2748378 RepID=A0A345N2J1_9VIRU|nr:MAG: putative capsid protein [Cressdnaviricota sp.]
MAMRARRRFARRSRPFRRSRVRRRVIRRKPRTVRDRYQATSDINRGGWNFRRKRFNPRAARRANWRASEAAQKYRSNNAEDLDIPTAAFTQQQSVNFIAFPYDQSGGQRFWQVAGGLITNNDTPATTDFGGGDLFIRGGSTRFQITNSAVNTGAVRVTTWLAKTTVNGGIPISGFIASQGWDPSLPDPALAATDPNRDVYKLYKFWGCQESMLKPGESMERIAPIPSMKVDQDQWINNRGRPFLIVALQRLGIDGAILCDVNLSFNLSFTADRVV